MMSMVGGLTLYDEHGRGLTLYDEHGRGTHPV